MGIDEPPLAVGAPVGQGRQHPRDELVPLVEADPVRGEVPGDAAHGQLMIGRIMSRYLFVPHALKKILCR
jgi:hypothetical protein